MTASFGTSRRTALTFLEITARRVRGSELLGLACVFRARFYHDHSELGLEGMKSGHRVPQQLENPCSTGMTLVRLLSRAIFGQWAKFSANQEPERFSGPRLTAANHHLMQFRSWSPPALECTLTGQLGLPHRGDIGVAGKL
ncbi:uncharacterized protein LOC144115531 isoform X4 [Amblyomma americanum]